MFKRISVRYIHGVEVGVKFRKVTWLAPWPTVLLTQFLYSYSHNTPSLYHSLHSWSCHSVLIIAEFVENKLSIWRVNCVIRYTDSFETKHYGSPWNWLLLEEVQTVQGKGKGKAIAKHAWQALKFPEFSVSHITILSANEYINLLAPEFGI